MPRPFTPKVVTANDLLIGDVIYLTATGGWTRDLAQAEVLTVQTAAEARLEAAEAQVAIAVGAYLADVDASADTPRPTHFREDFRMSGPSNYYHGKQAARA